MAWALDQNATSIITSHTKDIEGAPISLIRACGVAVNAVANASVPICADLTYGVGDKTDVQRKAEAEAAFAIEIDKLNSV